MTKVTEIFKCQVCNNIVEVIKSGEGELYCCNKPMIHLIENKDDTASKEKHVPVFDEVDNKIKVGANTHPMLKEHYIEFIEAISPDKKYIIRKYLNPGEEPTLETNYDWSNDVFIMRELCNLHGLWENKKESN